MHRSSFQAVVQEARRQARAARLREELGALQDYWSRRAQERGILSEADLDRYLRARKERTG